MELPNIVWESTRRSAFADQSGRPVEIAHGGKPIHDILA
jgi:hypothetical protein